MSRRSSSASIIVAAFALLAASCLDTQVPLGARADTADAADAAEATQATTPDTRTDDDAPAPEPCLRAAPDELQLDNVLVGNVSMSPVTLTNCGDGAITLGDLAIVDASDATFALVPDLPNGPWPLAPGASLLVHIAFTPVAAAARSTATLRVSSDDARLAPLDVALVGTAFDPTCPRAVITCSEGDQVIVQTTLHCWADATAGAGGPAVTGYTWRVSQPVGSAELIQPSDDPRAMRFTANIIGQYRFEVDVVDAQGRTSCATASYDVSVTTTEVIHVELLWHTPADPDETDSGFDAHSKSVGSDLDLHFLHPMGAWFDAPWDVYWFNNTPNWNQPFSGTARLDRDDTDGAGPENVNLDRPEDGASYRVGVHYWDDNDFGPAFATVRVYIYATLVWEMPMVELSKGDLWEVCTIAWPSASVSAIATPPHIIPSYPVPLGGD